ncbi:MAG: sugar phosphate isomerase/epimerase, partial [Verrucomicrobiae bacterium]|nr:sugar phosphate isomerase/epimerase [Verrucomicrobiae bacterium]
PPVAEHAKLLRELGFDGVGYPLWLDEKLDQTLKTLDEFKLQPYQLWLSVNVNPKMRPYDPRVPDAIRKLKGRPAVICVLTTGFKPGDPAGIEPAVKVLREMGDIAAQAGVRVSIYNHVNNWTERVPFGLEVVKALNHPAVGANFNLCHWLKVEGDKDYRPLLRENVAKIFTVTINGAQRDAKTWTNGLIQPLDKGDFDNRQLLATLREAGYRGPIGLMCYGIPDDTRDHLTRSMNVWKRWRAEWTK